MSNIVSLRMGRLRPSNRDGAAVSRLLRDAHRESLHGLGRVTPRARFASGLLQPSYTTIGTRPSLQPKRTTCYALRRWTRGPQPQTITEAPTLRVRRAAT